MKPRKSVRSKGLKAYIYPDMDFESPFEWFSAVPLYKNEYSYGNDYEGDKGERIWMFCNDRFNPDRFYDMDFDSDEAMCDYLSHFGCLAVPFYGSYRDRQGILVMSSEDIPKKGYRSRKEAKGHFEGIADMYSKACDGEVYGLAIVDTPGTEDDLDPEYVDRYPHVDEDEGEEVVLSVGGYFGADHVKREAGDEMRNLIAQRSKSKKAKSKPKAKRRVL